MGDETLRTVARTLDLLQAFGRGPPAQTTAELVERLSLPRTVVTRMLATLEKAGFVERVPTNRRLFRVGPAAGRVGALYRLDPDPASYQAAKASLQRPAPMVTPT